MYLYALFCTNCINRTSNINPLMTSGIFYLRVWIDLFLTSGLSDFKLYNSVGCVQTPNSAASDMYLQNPFMES